ncbi:hypothetical protein SteCoe_30589 [Stentor coeruleus]|uniref:Uncharacterized protein n=1 Tax=Stentor coeruleus TaxID=5963 RepID=A0A1R2B3B8_9CILI|nr:hypothetical protein SteCoe_30589 [Stentor coeruleus]
MCLDFYPSSMESIKSSNHRKFLKYYRIGALILYIIGFLIDRDGYFEFYGSIFNSKITIGAFYFFITLLPYFHIDFWDVIDKVACISFLMSWAMILPLAILEPAYIISVNILSPTGPLFTIKTIDLCFGYILPVVLLVIDYALNKVSFIREQYVFALGYCIAAVFFGGFPSESDVEAFIPGVFIALRIFIIVFGLIFLEIGRAIKNKLNGNSDLNQGFL